jgi:hypothetical protein
MASLVSAWSSIFNPAVAAVPVGMWAKARPLGEADRPHIHTGILFRRLGVACNQALVLALLV